MDAPRSLEESAAEVRNAIGLNLSYFADDADPHFDPLSVALGVGFALLANFLRGFVKQLNEDAPDLGKTLAKSLTSRLNTLFSTQKAGQESSPRPVEKAVLESEVREALKEAAVATKGVHVERIVKSVEVTEEHLRVYLVDEKGMPRRDAERVARSVRMETLRQLGVRESR